MVKVTAPLWPALWTLKLRRFHDAVKIVTAEAAAAEVSDAAAMFVATAFAGDEVNGGANSRGSGHGGTDSCHDSNHGGGSCGSASDRGYNDFAVLDRKTS